MTHSSPLGPADALRTKPCQVDTPSTDTESGIASKSGSARSRIPPLAEATLSLEPQPLHQQHEDSVPSTDPVTRGVSVKSETRDAMVPDVWDPRMGAAPVMHLYALSSPLPASGGWATQPSTDVGRHAVEAGGRREWGGPGKNKPVYLVHLCHHRELCTEGHSDASSLEAAALCARGFASRQVFHEGYVGVCVAVLVPLRVCLCLHACSSCVCVHLCMPVCSFMHACSSCVCVHACVPVCLFVPMHLCFCVPVCKCVCVGFCAHVC